MREHDALEHNPQVSLKALETLHSQLFGWALTRCGYDQTVAEDLMQQAYVEVLSGRARFDDKSTLKTFVFGIVQNLARSRIRQMAVRLRLINTYANPDDNHHSSTDNDDHGERKMIWQAVESLADFYDQLSLQAFGNYRTMPMQLYSAFHDTGPKTILNGVTVPAGQTGDQDLAMSLDNVFNHANLGPFLSYRLIQRLVTSNPSPEYIQRVAAVFDNNGFGVRGDLDAVVRAILLDDEARPVVLC